MQTDAERELVEAIHALKELHGYGFVLLKEMEQAKIDVYSLGRDGYLLTLFISAIAQVQGITSLADSKQFRVSYTLARTLFEIWINVRLIYCCRSLVYAKYMIMTSERKRIEMLAVLHSDGHVSDEDFAKHKNRLLDIESTVALDYPKWPDAIPEVINPAKTTPVTRTKGFSLKQRCEIIDFYNQKYHRIGKKTMTMVRLYDRLYPFFSGGSHADPIELASVIKESPERIDVSIDGSTDVEGMVRSCRAVFAYQWEITRQVKHYIFHEAEPKMPAWIDHYARQIKLVK